MASGNSLTPLWGPLSLAIAVQKDDGEPMRIMIAHPALLSESSSEGGIKSTRALAAALVAGGHDCDLVSVPSAEHRVDEHLWDRLGWEKFSSYVPDSSRKPGRMTLSLTEPFDSISRVRETSRNRGFGLGVLATFVRLRQAFMSTVRHRVRTFHPDWVLWENGVGSLRTALSLSRGRLLVQVKSPAFVPFGPYGAPPWFHMSGYRSFRRVTKYMVPSAFMQDYMSKHVGVDACVQRNLAYGKPPFPLLATFDGAITMINPTPAKGVSIFAALARAFPKERFRAVKTWGAVPEEISSLPNVEIANPGEDMNDVLKGTKVLLVPSMWGEAFGMVCVDAMLRGIPTLYSNDGGVPEAALGVGRPLAIRPRILKRRWMRPALMEYPTQDVESWRRCLEDLLRDRGAYDVRSELSRRVALEYVTNLNLDSLEHYLT